MTLISANLSLANTANGGSGCVEGWLAVGEVGEVSAQITQDGREVPVAWPVTAQWGGTGVQIGTGGADAEKADPRAVVRVDPRTGEVTGLRRGAATVTVTVNGETARLTVQVAGDGR